MPTLGFYKNMVLGWAKKQGQAKTSTKKFESTSYNPTLNPGDAPGYLYGMVTENMMPKYTGIKAFF